MKNMKKSIIVITAIMAISSGASANPFAKKSQPVEPAPVVEKVEQAPAVQAEPAKSQAVATVAAKVEEKPKAVEREKPAPKPAPVPAQKAKIAEEITDTLQRIAHKPKSYTYITFQEVEGENWAIAGELLDSD